MTDRATGSYTHERLIALEDSHDELARFLRASVDGILSDEGKRIVKEEVLPRAYKIQEEAGL